MKGHLWLEALVVLGVFLALLVGLLLHERARGKGPPGVRDRP